MDIPVLKHNNYLIASIQAALCDGDLIALRDKLVNLVTKNRSTGVILDVSGLDVMDSFSSRIMRDITHMIRLRGSRSVIVGIQPAVAFSMVQLGLTLNGVPTALDLDEGLAYLDAGPAPPP
jgi:rsbT antagonist protein RsbS